MHVILSLEMPLTKLFDTDSPSDFEEKVYFHFSFFAFGHQTLSLWSKSFEKLCSRAVLIIIHIIGE